MPSAWRERRGKKFRVRYRDKAGRLKVAGTFPSALDADEEIARIEGAQLGQPVHPGQRMSLDHCARAYVRARVADGSMSKGNAYTCERAVTEHAAAQGWKTVADVTPAALRLWRTKETPRVGAWRHLRAVLRWSAFELDQPVDARLLIRVPSIRRAPGLEPELMPDALVRKALRAAKLYPSAHALLHWLASYGPRPVTLFHMLVGDIDLANASAKVRHNKNRHPYEHPLLPTTVALLRPLVRGRDRDDRLFLDPRTGKPWEFSKVESANRLSEWYRVYIAAKFPKQWRGPYTLKDWAVSKMLSNGMPEADVIRYSGHLNKKTLEFYRKTSLEAARRQLHHVPAAG